MICDFCTKINECNLICSDIYCHEFSHEIPFEEIKPGDTLYRIYSRDSDYRIAKVKCISKDAKTITIVCPTYSIYSCVIKKGYYHQYHLYRDYHEAREVASMMEKHDDILEDELLKALEEL